MTLCPIALAVGCKKCLAFRICPLTTVLGDVPKVVAAPAPKVVEAPSRKAKAPVRRRPKRRR